jgi:uncharacterized membrane protein YedE/YeeE
MMRLLMPLLASFACGLLFGIGLLVSGMTSPAKVLGFLDLFGAWDATLAFVMAGAVVVTSVGYRLARRRGTPLLDVECLWPTRSNLDAPLVVGSVLFGIGWGLVGLCPGPALVNLAGLSFPVIVFVAAMAAGMFGFDLWQNRQPAPRRDAAIATGDG